LTVDRIYPRPGNSKPTRRPRAAGDIDGFGELIADDFVEHEETPGPAPTKEGVLDLFRMYRAAFP
jgi:hypothetical protein